MIIRTAPPPYGMTEPSGLIVERFSLQAGPAVSNLRQLVSHKVVTRFAPTTRVVLSCDSYEGTAKADPIYIVLSCAC